MSDKLVMNETVLKQFLAELDDNRTHPDAQMMMQILWQVAQDVLGVKPPRQVQG